MNDHRSIRRYTAGDLTRWNEFLTNSRNGTFLFNRNYMDYHSDRFSDFSLIAEHNGKIVAILPAHYVADTLYSHRGLTYGGWVIPAAHFDGSMMMSLFDEWIKFCRAQGFSTAHYKPIPWFYSLYPAQEDEYALFRYGASVEKVQISSTIDLRSPLSFNMSKRQQVKKAHKCGINIEETRRFDEIWPILENTLKERHNATPVHTLSEIELLASRFPDNIRLFKVSDEEGVQGGICIFDTGRVAHSQYTASTPKARCHNYVAALYHHLISDTFASRRYFDFGISTENGGQELNSGLLNQKFSMGGTATIYTEYKLEF